MEKQQETNGTANGTSNGTTKGTCNGITNGTTNGTNHETIKNLNRNVSELKVDNLYHLALSTETHNLYEMFHDVKFVCMGGASNRMKNFALFMTKKLNLSEKELVDISNKANRYAMYKCGPVISVSHGMGVPSLSILMHEILKLLHHAKAQDVIFLRLGTSGGIGLEPGTVVISEKCVNGLLNPCHEVAMLGKLIKRPTLIDQALVDDILESSSDFSFPITRGTTMATDDFYEGQGRLDGVFCDYTEEEKMEFLHKLKNNGVKNIEMEATAFAAFCYRAGVRGGVLCVTLVNRLKGDQISTPKHILEEWQLRPQEIAANFILKTLKTKP